MGFGKDQNFILDPKWLPLTFRDFAKPILSEQVFLSCAQPENTSEPPTKDHHPFIRKEASLRTLMTNGSSKFKEYFVSKTVL